MTELESIKEAFVRLLRQERDKISKNDLYDTYYIGKDAAWKEAIKLIQNFRDSKPREDKC